MLSRVRQYVNTNTAVTIFKSMILPYTEYGNIFNGTCNEIYKHKLQVIQNNALKIALNKNNLWVISPKSARLGQQGPGNSEN